MKKIRKIIRDVLPYGIVKAIKDKRYIEPDTSVVAFWKMYQDYLNRGEYVTLKQNSPFETVVSVCGLNYTGSSAVVDLLREYDNLTTIGWDDPHVNLVKHDDFNFEVTFLITPGGLMEFERFLKSHNIGHNSALLKRYMDMAYCSPLFWQRPEIRPYCFEFFRHVCTTIFNPFAPDETDKSSWFPATATLLNNMSVAQYRNLCRRFLNSIFSVMQDERRPQNMLVLDHLFTLDDWNTEQNLCYVPNAKSIVVIRDFRDLFAFGNISKWKSIPYRDATKFVEYYKYHKRLFNNNDYLVIWLEDMVQDYQGTKERIENYLGIESAWHARPRTTFVPEISAKYQGLWKIYPEWQDAYRLIEKELPEFCYKEK